MVGPQERRETVRDAMRRYLRQGWTTSLQLSSLVGVSEKVIPEHLEHLRRSCAGTGELFELEPAVCSRCDYAFPERERLTRPSRCPSCKGERIEPPRFRIRPE